MTTMTAAQAFFDQLEHADPLHGPAREAAYDKLMKLVGPALQDIAQEELPEACELLFTLNHTDEGSFLFLSSYRTAAGKELQVADCPEAAMIDEAVFVGSGAGEDGTNIPGMKRIGLTDRYMLQITAKL